VHLFPLLLPPSTKTVVINMIYIENFLPAGRTNYELFPGYSLLSGLIAL
jgi:hypothetical protein